MADPLTLSKLTELPPIRCYECGTIIGQSYEVYVLMINTFAELVPQYKDQTSVQNFQDAWNYRRGEQLDIVRQLRSQSVANIGINFDDHQWRIIIELSKVFKNVENRINTRKRLAEKALIELRENYLKDNNKPVTVDNAMLINFDEGSIYEEIVKMRGTRKQITDIGFLNLSITERLKRVRYPSEESDTKWADLAREKLNINNVSDTDIESTLRKVLNIPKLTIIPEVQFSDNDWKRLSTTAKRSNILSQYGGVSMDILGYTRSCCRQNLAQPIILPMEAVLETADFKTIERMDPKTLIYSRFTSALDMPTIEAERLFIDGKISSIEAFSNIYTRRALGIKTGFSASITSPINAMTGGDVGIRTELPIQTSMSGYGYGGIVTQTLDQMQKQAFAENNPYQIQSPSTTVAGTSPEVPEKQSLPAPTFGGIPISTGSKKNYTPSTNDNKNLPVPTFGGTPISVNTVVISKPLDIGIIPSFRKNKERIQRQARSHKQPGGLDIPLEDIPGDLKVYPAI